MPRIAASGQERPFEQTSVYGECSGSVNVIASIENPAVINRILAHEDEKKGFSGNRPVAEMPGPTANGMV